MAASKERLVVNLEALVAVEAYADTVLKRSHFHFSMFQLILCRTRSAT